MQYIITYIHIQGGDRAHIYFETIANSEQQTFKQLLDAIEDDAKAGGCIIDWHACDLFPKSWIDLVVVLRADSATHYDRLKARSVIKRLFWFLF